MILINQFNFYGKDKVQVAVDRIRQFEPPEGYYFGDSGGKDSCVVRELLKIAGVKYDAHHNLTTVGPPEQIRFIQEYHPETVIEMPKKTMWQLIVKNGMPPTRLARYCCESLKEHGGSGRFKVLGLRWAESGKRKNNRRMVESCLKNDTRTLNPIIDWTADEVWQFIREYNVDYCPTYDNGYTRLGCIMCPQKGTKGMVQDARNYPKHYEAYLRAFRRMLDHWDEKGKPRTWKSEEEVMHWWIYDQ